MDLSTQQKGALSQRGQALNVANVYNTFATLPIKGMIEQSPSFAGTSPGIAERLSHHGVSPSSISQWQLDSTRLAPAGR